MKWLRRNMVTAMAALIVLAMLTPILPSSLLVQQRALSVDNTGFVTSVRTVTVPVDIRIQREVMRGQEIIVPCNKTTYTHFEARGLEPVQFSLNCELTDGDYTLRYCLSVDAPLNMELRPLCTEADFVIGEPVYEQLQRQVEELQQEIEVLK